MDESLPFFFFFSPPSNIMIRGKKEKKKKPYWNALVIRRDSQMSFS